MIENRQHQRPDWSLRGRLAPLVGVLCVLLVALLATIQTTHVDPVGTDASHCPLCIVLHTAAPVTPPAAAIVLVPLGLRELVFKARPVLRFWRPKFFTRPPPAGC